jgi:hypothetical protein
MGAIHFSIDERLLTLFARELPILTFVETGTFKGESLRAARKIFPECHSIEMSPEYFAEAQKNFANSDGIHLHHGDSPSALSRFQQTLASKPTLFWLDAHWCVGEHTAGAESQSPLLGELRAIGELHPESVVLIDDARLYLCAPPQPHRYSDWPGLHDVVQALFALNTNHRLCICNDVVMFYPARVEAAVSRHAHEHGVDWLSIARKAAKQDRKRRPFG